MLNSNRKNADATMVKSQSHGLSILAALTAVLLTLIAASAHAQNATALGNGTITTYAGIPSSQGGSSTMSGPAAQTEIGFPQAVVTDANGNVYIAGSGNVIYVVYAGGPVPPLLSFVTASPAAGYIYPIAGTSSANNLCQPNSNCGDGGPALNAAFNMVQGMAFDPSGNLYLADSLSNAIRRIDAKTGLISTIAGDPLHVATGYSGENVAASSSLLNNPFGIAIDGSGNIFIADSTNFIVRRIDAKSGLITTVAGTHPDSSGNTFECVSAPCGDSSEGQENQATTALLGYPWGLAVDGKGNLYIADLSANEIRKVDNKGIITNVAGTLLTPCAPVDPPAVSACGADGTPATQALLNNPQGVAVDSAGNIFIADYADNAVRVVDTAGAIHPLVGQVVATGMFSGDNGAAIKAGIFYPDSLAFDSAGDLYLSDNGNAVVRKVAAPAQLKPQTITFNALPDITYGESGSVQLDATSDSGLAVSYAVTGPATISGTTLTVTGAGTVSVTASQSGDSNYSAATPVTRSFQVAKGLLSVTADNLSRSFGAANPPLTYKITGFAENDTASVVSGAPVLSTSATAASPVGQYPIVIATGTLTATNYNFKLVNGVLTITGGATQSIHFGSLPNLTYGAASFVLNATATSGLPISYSVTGPAEILGSTVTVTGAGTVGVKAAQPGNSSYAAAAPVTQTFTVAPAVLTITADNLQRQYNQPNPAFTFTPSGFVSADNASVLSGAPAFTVSASLTSPVGQYAIGISQGTLFAQNYTFRFINGVLTVGPASQTITFPPLPDVPYNGVYNKILSAVASSGLPVKYTSTGPITIDATNSFTTTGVGPVTITATQPGNADYAPAPPVTVSFKVTKGTLPVVAINASRPFGGDNPTFTYQISQLGNPLPPNVVTGVPLETTTATSQSPTGTYPIIISQGTLTSPLYDFQFVNGVLTVTPPSSYILTASPGAVTIPSGQSRQVTLTATPINNYTGTITIGCESLPAGVTCTASPAALSIVTGNPVQGTLTISAGNAVAAIPRSNEQAKIRMATLLSMPAFCSGVLIALRRRKIQNRLHSACVMLVLAIGIAGAGLIGCGGGSSSSNQIQKGTTQITVTGVGSTSPGTGDVNQTTSLTVTID